jgi:hypothetical protein
MEVQTMTKREYKKEELVREMRNLQRQVASLQAKIDVVDEPTETHEIIDSWLATEYRGLIEVLAFASANELCVDLGYNGTVRRVAPYSLRRNKRLYHPGILFFAKRVDRELGLRSYSMDKITSAVVTDESFPVDQYEPELGEDVTYKPGMSWER